MADPTKPDLDDQNSTIEAESRPVKKLPNWLKTLFAIAGSLAILFYYFHDKDWHKLVEAASQANIGLAWTAAFIIVANGWFFEVFLRGVHFSWFHDKPFPWKDYFFMRGALYLVMIINGPISGAARALYVVKKTEATWMLYFGIALFRVVTRGGAIAILMLPITFFMHQYDLFERTGINPLYWWGFIIWNIAVLIDAYFVFFKGRFFGLSRLLKNKLDHPVFYPLNVATAYQWLWTMLVGFLPVFIFIGGYWLMATAFGINIPPFYFLVTIALVLVVSGLPISFGGFGTTTMAWMLFYKDYAQEDLLLSFTLFLPMSLLVMHALGGLISLKPALTDLSELLRAVKEQDKNKESETAELKNLFMNQSDK